MVPVVMNREQLSFLLINENIFYVSNLSHINRDYTKVVSAEVLNYYINEQKSSKVLKQ